MNLKLQILSPLRYTLKRQEKGNCSPQIQHEDKRKSISRLPLHQKTITNISYTIISEGQTDIMTS